MQVRRPEFRHPEDFDAAWHPRRPEVAAAANAVSLLMPHTEPLVALTVRAAHARMRRPSGTLVPGTSCGGEVKAYVRQELQHQRQHRRLNDLLIAQHPALRWVDRGIAVAHRWIASRSLLFRLAFAAGFETVAYGSARWVDGRLHRLFGGAEETAATLFLWHLAEEVEHKAIVFDVFAANAEATACRRRFDKRARAQKLAGMVTVLVILGLFGIVGSLVLLAGQSKLRAPLAVARLAGWALSIAFEVLPQAFVSLLDGHDPRDLADPSWYRLWLDGFDAASATLPPWDRPRAPPGAQAA